MITYTKNILLGIFIAYGLFSGAHIAEAKPLLINTVDTVEHYTYSSKCPATSGEKQSIIFDKTSSGFDTTYLFIHGQNAPSPKTYCTGSSYKFCKHAKERNKAIIVAFAFKGSGAEWVNPMDFTCMYNEAKDQISQIGKTMPQQHILGAFSYGGAALKKIYTKNQQPSNIIATLEFDSCFASWCSPVAALPSSKRGALYMYTSNSVKKTDQRKGAADALKKSKDAISYTHVDTTSHGSIPGICFPDHYKQDKCGGKGKLAGGKNDPSGSITTDLKRGYDAKPLTKDELQDLISKPVPLIKIPGLSFSAPNIDSLSTFGADGKAYLNIPFLGEYIAAIYQYTIIFVSVLATIMLIISGIQWTLGGSSSGGREGVKKRILGSIVGLALSVGSYTILYTVNPELVTQRSLQILFINEIPFPIITEESGEVYANTNYDSTTEIAVKVPSVAEVDSSYFMSTGINGKRSNGWSIWQGLTAAEKTLVLPYMFKQTAPSCPEGHLVKISGIPGWNGKKIHPAALEPFRKVNETAKKLGMKLYPGTVQRAAKTMVPLWNTGIVARYKQGRKWKKNEGKIAKPTCNTGHSMGAAVDANMKHEASGKKLGASDPTKINQKNYAKKFLGNPMKVILEQIFHQNGWVRYCSEHWHFEYGVTKRAKKWDKKSRCWQFNGTFDQPIPQSTKDEVNKLVGFKFLN